MIDLKNYAPQTPEFKLPKNVSFPRVIFEGARDMDEIRKHLSGKFIAESVTSAKAVRLLDSYEKASIRSNYSELMEDEQPKLETQLAEIEASCKQMMKDAREKLQAVITQIRDLVYQVKRGEKEVDLPSDTTVKMALCGHYLYYAWIDGRFQLCKVEKIPSWDEQSLFANLETNKQAFLDVLRDGHRCRLCGGTYSLEIHHTTYYVNAQSIVGHEKEHLDCLITLCAECHRKQHDYGKAK